MNRRIFLSTLASLPVVGSLFAKVEEEKPKEEHPALDRPLGYWCIKDDDGFAIYEYTDERLLPRPRPGRLCRINTIVEKEVSWERMEKQILELEKKHNIRMMYCNFGAGWCEPNTFFRRTTRYFDQSPGYEPRQ